MSDAVTLHSLAASVVRVEARITSRATERAAERAADITEIDEKFAAFIEEFRGIVNKVEEDKAKAKKERVDADARMWQGLMTLMSLFSWKRIKAD